MPSLPAILVVLVAVLALGHVLLRPPFALVRLLAARLPGVTFFAARDDLTIALTLDDGPDPATTPRVLDVLAAHGAHATFFLLGEAAAEHPELVARIAREGHELANHTMRDEPSWRLSAEALERSVAETHHVLARSGPVSLLRPGSGWVNGKVLDAAARHGYRCVLASVYPHDPHIRWTAYIAWDVVRRVRAGAIVVLHEGPGRERIVDVLERALPALAERGYTVTTVSTVLGRGG